MIEEFLSKFPSGTNVHLALSNKNIIGLFKDLGFIETEELLEFWGKPSNALNLKKLL
jgi:ribosomal protein S18 acetylase RimI-like enzyme